MPASWLFQYSLRNGGSVPSFCVTRYWVSVRRLERLGGLAVVGGHCGGSSLVGAAGCGVIEKNGCRALLVPRTWERAVSSVVVPISGSGSAPRLVDPGRELPGLGILSGGNGREPDLTRHLDEEVVRLGLHRPLQQMRGDRARGSEQGPGDGGLAEPTALEQLRSRHLHRIGAGDRLAQRAEVDPAAIDDDAGERLLVAAELGGVRPAGAVPPALATSPVVVPARPRRSPSRGRRIRVQLDVTLAEVDVVLRPARAVPPALLAGAVVVPACFRSSPCIERTTGGLDRLGVEASVAHVGRAI